MPDLMLLIREPPPAMGGLLVTLLLSGLTRYVMGAVELRSQPTHGLSDVQRDQWALWQRATQNQHVRRSGFLLGALESTLLFAAIWTGAEVVVGGWLAFKLAAKWESWSHIVSPSATTLPFPDDELRSLWARHGWGVQLLRRFLIGTLWNLLSAGVGVLVGRHVLAALAR